MIEPHLAGPERARRGEVLARDNVIAVGGPVRSVEQAEAFLGDRALGRSVAVHYPDIVAAAAVGRKGDFASVGRVARLHVPRVAARQRPGLAAGDRHDVNVAEHVEGDLTAVGRDVEVHPRALGDVDQHVVAGPMAGGDIPPRRFLLAGRRGRGDPRGLGLGHRLDRAGLREGRANRRGRRRLGVGAGREQSGGGKQDRAAKHDSPSRAKPWTASAAKAMRRCRIRRTETPVC